MLMIVKGREKKSFGVISITRVTVGCTEHTLRSRRTVARRARRNLSPTESACPVVTGRRGKPTRCAGLGDSARGRASVQSARGRGSARGGGRALRGVVAAPAAGEGRHVSPHLGRAPVGAETPGPVGARVDEHALP